MAFSKADHYEAEEQKMGHYSAAFMHPARQRILKQLKKEGMLTVLELNKQHPLSQPTLSEHLAGLRKAGLIKCDAAFPYSYYQIIMEEVARARKTMNAFFDELEGKGL